MCDISKAIQEIRDTHRDCARIPGTPKDVQEINFHIAIEAEKYLRHHEARCATCMIEDAKHGQIA